MTICANWALLKMGPRKKLLGRILKLKQRGSPPRSTTRSVRVRVRPRRTSPSSEDASSSNAEIVVSHRRLQETEPQAHRFSSHVSLESLSCSSSRTLSVVASRSSSRTSDGDQIAITSDHELADALAGEDAVTAPVLQGPQVVGRYPPRPPPHRLGRPPPRRPSPRSAAGASAAAARRVAEFADRYAMFDELLDPYIVIDAEGTVLAFNPSAEKLLGYAKKKVLGKNVKMLMPDTYAKKHDSYLAKYARTGVKNVIDSKRTVMAKASSGSMIAVELGVTEKELGDMSRTLSAACASPARLGGDDSLIVGATAASSRRRSSSTKQMRKNMAALQEAASSSPPRAACVSSTRRPRPCLVARGNEVIGGPIEVLMPSPHKENHAYYLQRYVATGEQRVMNKSRDVQAKHKNGQMARRQSGAVGERGAQRRADLHRPAERSQADRAQVATGAHVVLKRGTLLQTDAPDAQLADDSRRDHQRERRDSGVQPRRREAARLHADRRRRPQRVDADERRRRRQARRLSGALHGTKVGAHHRQGAHGAAKHKSGKLFNVHAVDHRGQDEAGKKLFTGMLHKTKSDLAEVKAKRKTKKKRSGDD
jgi:PAS domain S-box-containing protein